MKEKLFTSLAVIGITGLLYGGWLLKREFNYSLDYKDKVIKTIKEQQKPLVDRLNKLEIEIKNLKKQGK